MNVTLRALAPDDATWLDAWFPAWATRLGYDATSTEALMVLRRSDATVRLLAVERDANAVGLLVCRTAISPGVAMIELVATAPEHARRGSGMRAAAMVEADLLRADAQQIVAPAPAAHGIAVYFWLRLGYRPLLREEWPCAREGTLWMAREIGTG